MKSLLLFLSKTDVDVYRVCPSSAKTTQLSLGLFVFLTGVLAFISGSYAVSNLFYEYDWQTNTIKFLAIGKIIAPIIGVFYAIMIMAIDREVVSATSKLAVVPRLALAIVIGFVVAVPIELKLLEGRINKQLITEFQQENTQPMAERDARLAALDVKKKELESIVKEQRDFVIYWSDMMQTEVAGRVKSGSTGKAGKGQAYYEATKVRDQHQGYLDEATANLNNFLNGEYKTERDRIFSEANNKVVSQQFDLLSRYEALHRIGLSSAPAKRMSMGITALFILFEIIPSLIKLLLNRSEYDALLEARRRLNIQLTHAVANEGMEEIEADMEAVLDNKHVGNMKHKRSPLMYMQQIRNRMIIE